MVSETFTVAWRRFDDVPEGEAALPWLLTTARKVLANHRRAAESRMRASLVGPRAGTPDHPEDVVGTARSSRRSTPWRSATGRRWRSSRGTGSRPVKPRS